MNHIKTMQQWCGSVLIVAQWKCESMFTTKAQKAEAHHTIDALGGVIVGVVKFE